MKKVYLFLFMLLFIAFLTANIPAEHNEELGIDTNSHTTVSGVRLTRDIPEGGLLLIPDSGLDRVMAFDPITGDLYDADFVPSDDVNLTTPIAAALHPDGNSILVSDQIADGLIQYDLDGNFMGWFAPSGGVNTNILDNVRGWGLKADGSILVTTAGGANADAIAEFDAAGNYVSNFIANGAGGMDGPFCVLYRETQDDYLVTASSSDAVHQFDNAGNYVGDLVSGINFPEQVTETPSGNLLVAGFSTPAGCYEYTSTGAYVAYYDVVGGMRGAYELGNGNILVTNATGVYEIDRNNTIISTEISGVNARFIYFVEGEGGAVNNPPLGVTVDDATGTVSWSAPIGEQIIYENFDSFNVGDYIAVVGENWTTWSNAPGGAEDALVTDVQAASPENSVVVEENQDLVLIMEDYTTGIYQFNMKMYVPTGYCGYFNLQKTSTPGEEWAFQIYYQTDGTALADAGGAGAVTHAFNHDEWMDLKVVVDLDSDWATYYFNDVEMIGYQWTLGCFGTPGLLQFGGVNIWGGANSTTTDTPMFYMDDVVISIPETRELTEYNVYLDGDFVVAVGIDVFEYTYSDLVVNEEYVAGVSALYDTGESEIIEVSFTFGQNPVLDPPVNLAIVSNPDDDFATFTWEAPAERISVEVVDHNIDSTRDLLGYNVYLDGVLLGDTSDLVWILTGLENSIDYVAGVEAVYDEGISDVIEISFNYTGTIAGDVIVATTKLHGNYPNPFNPVTSISYSIVETGNVELEIYNLRGQLVKTLVNDVKEAGEYTAIWNGTDNTNKSVSSGVYFYKMKSGNYTATKKMILMK
ncbi:MAG: T9SS type A sorting domain-containing protein [Candidatus Cloacimonetes bacterium]|nr:T9SS type A sorting domain-containing protein [Candidatus Cloacimonadota bacterium]